MSNKQGSKQNIPLNVGWLLIWFQHTFIHWMNVFTFTSLSAVIVKIEKNVFEDCYYIELHELTLRFDWHLFEGRKVFMQAGTATVSTIIISSLQGNVHVSIWVMVYVLHQANFDLCQGFGLIGWNLTSCVTSSIHIPSSFLLYCICL